ncbi:DUF4942 domain-containing protein [Mesorhizobium sp. NBSH29]|uniref:DUF4942 domain-containing protein n=1 Tax=Mesorhizobium sp. NBSH29 TaxID=2654249 RepID=UPI0018964F32|nr:DUF4942 domain-containing protein [Mesorhizobium sp. NBSH29]QPC87104.1 DUF4942 domain-containing protein [Mesorhizobium sp. NBSH29]
MNAIMPRNTVEDIVSFRNQALELYADAYAKIAEADDAIRAAKKMASRASPGINSYNDSQIDEIKQFNQAVSLPERDLYLRTARRLIDVNVWSWIVERTDLERLMDKEAKDQLRNQMRYIPDRLDRHGQLINQEEIDKGMPDVTVENIFATLETFMLDSDHIFRRGVANAFSRLDRRFRSHDGFKIGARLILDYAFNQFGSYSFSTNHRDTLLDIERTFLIVDGQSVKAAYAGIVGQVEQERRQSGKWGDPQQSEHEGAYFKVRCFKNGNAHLWFTRDDLVTKVNQILAEWYGETIGDGQTKEEDPLNNPKMTPAKRYGFFPTPSAAAGTLVGGVHLTIDADKAQPLRILEPSSGTGNLARLLVHKELPTESYGRRYSIVKQTIVDCVEIQPTYAAALSDERIYNRVFCQDFIRLDPKVTGLYDRVVMNPPFDRERDIDHVVHAMKFLKPTGELHAIMSAGTEFRETKKSLAFRAMMTKFGALWEDLPIGSFSEVGTNVSTVIVRVNMDGHPFRRWR